MQNMQYARHAIRKICNLQAMRSSCPLPFQLKSERCCCACRGWRMVNLEEVLDPLLLSGGKGRNSRSSFALWRKGNQWSVARSRTLTARYGKSIRNMSDKDDVEIIRKINKSSKGYQPRDKNAQVMQEVTIIPTHQVYHQ